MFSYKLRPDGSLPAEDDSLLHRPTDEDVEDPDIAWDNEADDDTGDAEPETPVRTEEA
jgi:hypothetical protein